MAEKRSKPCALRTYFAHVSKCLFCYSGGNDDSSGAVGSGGSSSCSPGDDEDEHTLSCRGGAIEGAAEEVEGLITQTTDADQSVDYELVDLNTTTTVTTQVNHQNIDMFVSF